VSDGQTDGRQTNGQTDGQNYDSQDRASIAASRGKMVTHVGPVNNRPKLKFGSMPNVMAALPNIGGALCSAPQSLADDHYSWSAVQ